jgi:hypothetical protein
VRPWARRRPHTYIYTYIHPSIHLQALMVARSPSSPTGTSELNARIKPACWCCPAGQRGAGPGRWIAWRGMQRAAHGTTPTAGAARNVSGIGGRTSTGPLQGFNESEPVSRLRPAPLSPRFDRPQHLWFQFLFFVAVFRVFEVGTIGWTSFSVSEPESGGNETGEAEQQPPSAIPPVAS